MMSGSKATLRTYAQLGQYASTIRPTGLAAAASASAQCTPQSTGMSPRSAKGTRSAPAHASHVLVTGAVSFVSGAREAGDDRGGGHRVGPRPEVGPAGRPAAAV